jgi:hypothetical protein
MESDFLGIYDILQIKKPKPTEIDSLINFNYAYHIFNK